MWIDLLIVVRDVRLQRTQKRICACYSVCVIPGRVTVGEGAQYERCSASKQYQVAHRGGNRGHNAGSTRTEKWHYSGKG